MKKIFILLSCLWFTTYSSYADSIPSDLQYNFKLNDHFIIKVQSFFDAAVGKNINKENLENSGRRDIYFAFTPIEKTSDSTKMKVQIKRIYRDYNNYIYDTQSGFTTLKDMDLFYLQLIDKPFYFWIDNNGHIGKLENFKNIVSEIFTYIQDNTEQKNIYNIIYSGPEYKDTQGLRDFILHENLINDLTTNIRNTIQFLFPPFTPLSDRKLSLNFVKPYYSKKNAKSQIQYGYGMINLFNNRTFTMINKHDFLNNLQDSVSLIRVHDTTQVKNLTPFIVLKDGKYINNNKSAIDTITYSKRLGRIVNGKLRLGYPPNYYGNSPYTMSFNIKGLRSAGIINIDYSAEKQLQQNKIVCIRGHLKNCYAKNGSLYLWNSYPDTESFPKQEFKIESNGDFNLTFPLYRPMELTLRIGDISDISSKAYNLFLEPGDEIEISLNQNKPLPEFNGKSLLKFTKEIQIEQWIDELQQKSKVSLHNIDKEISHILTKVNQLADDDSISIWAKKNLKANGYFGCLRTLQTIIHEKDYLQLNDPKIGTLSKKWLQNPLFDKYSCYTSTEMRHFIISFIRNKYSSESYKQFQNEDSKFNIANVILKDETKYFALTYYTHQLINKKEFYTASKEFNKLKELYPNSEFIKTNMGKLGDNIKIKTGKPAPDFSLKSVTGEKISLSNYKGKWIYLYFLQYNKEKLDMFLYPLQQIMDSINDTRFVSVVVLTNDSISQESISKIKENYKGIILLNPGWNNEKTKDYYTSVGTSSFLIDPNGNFDMAWDSFLSDYRLFGLYSVLKPLQLKYTHLIKRYMDINASKYRTHISKGSIYGALGGMLVASILLWLLFSWRNKKMKEKECIKREKVNLELKAIRSQLNPHFMFNTLNSIQHLVSAQRSEEATQYISEFSGLMRKVLNNSDKLVIPLIEEIESIETYLKLEALRFNFKYKINVDNQLDIYTIEIPGLLIQPFVENAVVHGISALKEFGKVEINIIKAGDHLLCTIDDNGEGYKPEKEKIINGQGIALSKRRLNMVKETFANQVDLKIINKADKKTNEKGTLVQIYYELEHD